MLSVKLKSVNLPPHFFRRSVYSLEDKIISQAITDSILRRDAIREIMGTLVIAGK